MLKLATRKVTEPARQLIGSAVTLQCVPTTTEQPLLSGAQTMIPVSYLNDPAAWWGRSLQ